MDKGVGVGESAVLTQNCQTKLEIEEWRIEIRGFTWWLEGKFLFSYDKNEMTLIFLLNNDKPWVPASVPVIPYGSFPVQFSCACLLTKTRSWCVNRETVYTALLWGWGGRGSTGRCLFQIQTYKLDPRGGGTGLLATNMMPGVLEVCFGVMQRNSVVLSWDRNTSC